MCQLDFFQVHSDHLAKLGTVMPSLDARQTYLLLENVVCNYAHPCVLDLKVGKRQYSDDCSETKVARKIARANQTTTASLGLRLTGMQVIELVLYNKSNMVKVVK